MKKIKHFSLIVLYVVDHKRYFVNRIINARSLFYTNNLLLKLLIVPIFLVSTLLIFKAT